MIKKIGILLVIVLFIMLCFSSNLLMASEEKAKTKSLFPLLRDKISEDIQLPRPFGISFFTHLQVQDFMLKQANISGLPIPGELLENVIVDNTAYVFAARADLWMFPFLNLYVMGGYTKGSAEVFFPVDSSIIFPIDMSGTYDWGGRLLGFGGVLAVGYGKFFLTLDTNYSIVWIDIIENRAGAWSISPRIGYRFPRFEVWIGAMYQFHDKDHQGTIELDNPLIPELQFDISLTGNKGWNTLLGINFPLMNRHLTLSLEGGFGKRIHFAAILGYRFDI